MPKVSVIIPVYGVENYIERCARSLFEQTLDDIEYIFIDDCSPDKSVDVLMNVIEQYPALKCNVLVIKNNQNSGPSATRNRGIKLAKGDYVICCDSDDYLEHNAYELMYSAAVKEQADIVACGMCGEDNSCDGIALFNSIESLSRESLHDITRIEGVLYSSSCNKLVKRDLFVKHSIYFHEEVKMWDDLFWVFRLRYFAKKTSIVNVPLYHYVERPNSIIKTDAIEKSNSQVRCASLIDSFIREHDESNTLGIVVEFLKFRARDVLFCDEYIRTWIEETKQYKIRQFVPFYGNKRTILYSMVQFGGIKVWNMLNIYRKIKKNVS